MPSYPLSDARPQLPSSSEHDTDTVGEGKESEAESGSDITTISFPRCPARGATALIFLRTPPKGESMEEDQGILSVGCSAAASSQGTPTLSFPANLTGRYRRAVELSRAMTPRACTLPLRVTREDHGTYLRGSERDPDVVKRITLRQHLSSSAR